MSARREFDSHATADVPYLLALVDGYTSCVDDQHALIEQFLEFVPSAERLSEQLSDQRRWIEQCAGSSDYVARQVRWFVLACELRGVPAPDWLRQRASGA